MYQNMLTEHIFQQFITCLNFIMHILLEKKKNHYLVQIFVPFLQNRVQIGMIRPNRSLL